MSITSETVDLKVLANLELGQVDGMDDLVVELIDLYVDDARYRLRVMEAAFTTQDAPTLKETAHCLKGSSGTVGALKLASICQQIERLDPDQWDTTQTHLHDLGVEFGAVCEVLLAERKKRMKEV